MKIYLDIDGTMIHEDRWDMDNPAAKGLEDFIIALRPYDTYWLTTHCTTGDTNKARQIMKKVLPQPLHPDIERIKGTVWTDMKTEALDWNSDFIWFDNDIFAAEWKALEQCKDNQSVVQVDLRNNPEQLIEITRDLLTS
jgi:hypothetical protein